MTRNLVTPAPESWYIEEAVHNFRNFLDEHALEPRFDFDGVAAVNDENAIAAIRVLQEKGLRVPDDISVTGFDDLSMAGSHSPALTTIKPSFFSMGYKAVELLIDLINGKTIDAVTVMPVTMTIRHSCGCLLPTIQEAVIGHNQDQKPVSENQSLAFQISGIRRKIISEMAVPVGSTRESIRWSAQILNGFINEIDHQTDATFIPVLHQVLNRVIAEGGRVKEWQRVLSVMRSWLQPFLIDPRRSLLADNLWHQGRVLVGELAWRHQSWKRLQTQERALKLRILGAKLATELKLENIWRTLTIELPGMDIHKGYIVLFTDSDQPAGAGKVVLSLRQQHREWD